MTAARAHNPQPVVLPAGVASDAPQSDLWSVLTTVPRPTLVVPFPRNLPGSETPVGELAIWPLTQEEQMAANAEADRFTKKLLKDPQQKDQANLGYHHTYSNETAIQVLYRACRNVDKLTEPAFPSPNAMRGALTTDEIGVLFNHYLTAQSELGPIVAYMSPEEMEGIILRIQASGSRFPFDTLSWEQQTILVGSLVSRLVTCWMAMSSAGLPLDVTTYGADRLRALVESQKAQASAENNGGDPATAQQSATNDPTSDDFVSPYGVTGQPPPNETDPPPQV